MVVERICQMGSVLGDMQYSVMKMSSEVWMLVSVWTFAEHCGRVSVERIREELTASLVSVAVVVLVHLAPVASVGTGWSSSSEMGDPR
jgi:hypothetical protein